MRTAYLLEEAGSNALKSLAEGALQTGWQVKAVTTVQALPARGAGDLVLVEAQAFGSAAVAAIRTSAPQLTIAAVLGAGEEAEVAALLEAGADQVLCPAPTPVLARAQLAALGRRSAAVLPLLVEHADQTLVGSLSRGLAHELNNPVSFLLANLRALRGYGEDLARALGQAVPPEVKEILEDLGPLVEESLEGATRVQRLVQALREFARTEDGEAEPVDVHEALETALQLTGAETRHRVRFVRRFQARVCALGWSAKLRQLLAYLVVCSVRALPKSDQEQPLVLSTANDGASLTLRFEAPGGFEPEVVRGTWEPFFANRVSSDELSLWLAAAASLVRLHRGTLSYLPALGLQVELPADVEA